MATGAERHEDDVRGLVLAVTATLAAGATFVITPGSGAGPATLALIAWLAALAAASWASLVDDEASTWRRVGAVLLAAVGGAGFAATVESGWALAIPGIAMAGALARRRSRARVVALTAWLVITGYVALGAASQ